MTTPRSSWVSAQAAHFDRWITEHPEAYEGDAYWDWTRDQFVRYVLRYLSPNTQILDIGCGDGYYAARLAEHADVRSVFAIDVSEQSIAYARTRGASAKATFTVADFMERDFGADRFDAVILSETIEHLADADAALEKIQQLIPSDGLLCVSTPNAARIENRLRPLLGMAPTLIDPSHAREFSGAELGRLAARRGFSMVSRRMHTAWGQWAFAPLFPLRRVHAIDAFLKSDFARGRCHWNYHLGRLLGPFGGTLQCIMRKV